ncbi:metalloreductase STEAP4-like [Notothenia coriiceps]|uniref:Metalloreductase STEAP4-like n=1 Tax=Notothenia coriiceps TaxID=8208 RepID=A0A6I9PG94_9TELE|nr:PREDICTED: metalloreductase STEAP4-like [Notothenia coriiceps]
MPAYVMCVRLRESELKTNRENIDSLRDRNVILTELCRWSLRLACCRRPLVQSVKCVQPEPSSSGSSGSSGSSSTPIGLLSEDNRSRHSRSHSTALRVMHIQPGIRVPFVLNVNTERYRQLWVLEVYLCGNSAEAKRAVAEMSTKLGLTVLDKGSLSAAGELEDFPLQLFPEWRLPLRVAVSLTAFFFFYLVIRDVVYGYVEQDKDISYRIMVSLANKVFPIVSLIMLALCYLPGGIAAFLQLYRGTKYRRFPDWLDRWMLCRKQMGLIALGLAFLHVIHTFMTPTRYSVRHKLITLVVDEMENNKTTPFYFDNTEAWGQDSFYALGILGFFLYVLLGLTSLPSVGGSLSWREFNFIQSKLGHLTLFICTAHGYIYGWNKFLRPSTYKWYTPPGYMLCLIVPSVVLVLKALVLLPCVDRTLTRIRQGWERNQPTEEIGKVTNL